MINCGFKSKKKILISMAFAVVALSGMSCSLLNTATTPTAQVTDLVLPSNFSGREITFFPDGYDKHMTVNYYAMSYDNNRLMYGSNSYGDLYRNLRWTFSKIDDNNGKLIISYPDGGTETYTLSNAVPPSGYRGKYYYTYEAVASSGQSYSYDGSFNLDADVGANQAVIVLEGKSFNCNSVTVTIGSTTTTVRPNEYKLLVMDIGKYTMTYYWNGPNIVHDEAPSDFELKKGGYTFWFGN
jgi:hypothetical protein